MSGEFRELSGCSFLWRALEEWGEDGNHEVSKALARLYEAVAPVEKACAWAEACESGPGYPYLELLKNIDDMEKAVRELKLISHRIGDVVESTLRDKK